MSLPTLNRIQVPADRPPLSDAQIEGVKFLCGGRHRLLLDDTGLRKTATTVIAAASIKAATVLVVCEPNTRYHWRDTFNYWSAKKYKVQVVTEQKTFVDRDASVVICPYNLLPSTMIYDQLIKRRWSVLVIDEIQNCKNSAAIRTCMVLGGSPPAKHDSEGNPLPRKRYKGLYSQSVFSWGLSATPMTTTPIDLWPTFKSLGRSYKKLSWMDYTRKYCGRFKGPWGWDVSGATNLKELRNLLFKSGFALRRTKEHRPGNAIQFIRVDEEPKVWDDRLDHADFNAPNLGLDAGTLARLRKEAGMSKLDLVSDYIIDRVSTSDKRLVLAWHTDVIEGIQEECRPFYRTALYYGKQTAKEKEQAKASFIEGDTNLLIANVKSGGTGMDGLQHVCCDLTWAEVPWNYTAIMQNFGRLDRDGQKYPVTGEILLIGNSTEDYILSKVLKKERVYELTFG